AGQNLGSRFATFLSGLPTERGSFAVLLIVAGITLARLGNGRKHLLPVVLVTLFGLGFTVLNGKMGDYSCWPTIALLILQLLFLSFTEDRSVREPLLPLFILAAVFLGGPFDSVIGDIAGSLYSVAWKHSAKARQSDAHLLLGSDSFPRVFFLEADKG